MYDTIQTNNVFNIKSNNLNKHEYQSRLLKYVEEEVKPLRQYIDHMINWHRNHPECTVNGLLDELESLPTIDSFRGLIYSINDVDDITSRNTFDDDFFVYILCSKEHEERFHNGKVFGASLNTSYHQHNLKLYQTCWRRMLPKGMDNKGYLHILQFHIPVTFH
ncbi:MAG: hypothetical protein ACI8RD_000032 [Bacillariaceae sp.]|jgi:hypothetical protein